MKIKRLVGISAALLAAELLLQSAYAESVFRDVNNPEIYCHGSNICEINHPHNLDEIDVWQGHPGAIPHFPLIPPNRPNLDDMRDDVYRILQHSF